MVTLTLESIIKVWGEWFLHKLDFLSGLSGFWPDFCIFSFEQALSYLRELDNLVFGFQI